MIGWLALVLAALIAGVCALRYKGRFDRAPAPARPPAQRGDARFESVWFAARDGARIEGWFFHPGSERPPVVILAPGLTGTKEGFYEDFAWAFAEAGIAALVIDYRCFGGSEGEPRHWVDPRRHQEDYEAAIAFARRELPIDPDRVALWGSSFSGGVALVTAASDSNVKAVVVQAPYLETSPAQEPTGWAMVRFVIATFLDMSRVAPVYVPALGRPGEWAFAKSAENPSIDDFSGPLGAPFWRALPKRLRGGWEPKFLARMLATFDAFQPMEAIRALNCPVMLVAAERDDLVPLEHVRRAHALLRPERRHLALLPCGHFDLYFSEFAAANQRAQAAWLAETLGVSAR